jgi:hypothetical protein
VAQSTASCCISSDISAFLITAFLSAILKLVSIEAFEGQNPKLRG